MSSQYGLEDADVSTIPAGSEVLYFEDDDDLEKFIKSEESLTLSETEEIVPITLSPGMDYDASCKTVEKTKSANAGFSTVRLVGYIKVCGTGSNQYIKSSTQHTEHIGFTLGLDWVEKNCFSNINKKSIDIYGRGVLNYIIFIKGIGKVYSRSIDLHIYYGLGAS